MGFNNLDDSREEIAKYLRRNPTTCFVAEQGEKIVGVILSLVSFKQNVGDELSCIQNDFICDSKSLLMRFSSALGAKIIYFVRI